MLITTNIVAGGLHYRGVQREYRLRTVATYFQQQKDHELKSHSSKSRMNARLVVTIMGDLFQILLLYASSIFLRRKNIFGVRGCVTIMRICIHVTKKKNFPFVMEYAYPSWLIAPKTVTWSVTIWISGTCLIVTRFCKICRPWWLSKYRDNS